jgi:PIN domain nuclease of toxin-antitoxin system
MLIAQAMVEEKSIITKDSKFDAYNVKVIWWIFSKTKLNALQ